MRLPGGWTCLLASLALVMASGTVHVRAQGALKGANQGGLGPAGQEQMGKIGSVKQVPSLRVPPLRVKAGNCANYGLSYYLETCSAPGFSALVAPMIKDHFYPEPADERDWQAQMRPFVPCLIQSLSSKDPCIQIAAIALLRKSEDKRAEAPLLDLLKKDNGQNSVAAEARQTLAVTFKSAMVVPYLVQALTPPLQDEQWVGYDVQAASRCPPDPRLFNALYSLFQYPSLKQEKGTILIALAAHRYGPACDARLRKVFTDIMKMPGCMFGADSIALAIARKETFDEIEAYFFTHCSYPHAYNPALVHALEVVGGEQYAAFLRKYFTFTKDEQQKKWTAEQLLSYLVKKYQTEVQDRKDSLDWLVAQAGSILPYAPARAIWPIFDLSTDAKADAPANRRAEFYEKAAKLFPEDKELSYQIQRRLYEAYGPNGTNEPEKSLNALSAANKAYLALYSKMPSVTAPWGQEEEALRRDIAVLKMREALKIVDAHPNTSSSPTGPWSATLLLPADSPFDLRVAKPLAYLDLLGETGLLRSIPARVAFSPTSGGKERALSIVIQPESTGDERGEKVRAVRIRLLFLPGKSGFYGTVVSDEVSR